jgi:hypothetical protein
LLSQREGLPQTPVHPLAQAEAVGQPPGHLAARGQYPLDRPDSR